MHMYQTTIKLHETDAAGVLFFANQLRIVHDAYEHLMGTIGFGLADIINSRDYRLPIVHSESDYKAPLMAGDRVTVETEIEHIGTTSFTFSYTLRGAEDAVAGTARTVHVAVDKKTLTKIPLPEDLRGKLAEMRG